MKWRLETHGRVPIQSRRTTLTNINCNVPSTLNTS